MSVDHYHRDWLAVRAQAGTGPSIGLLALVLAACSTVSGAAIGLKEIRVNGRPALRITTRHYEAIVTPGEGAQIAALRLNDSRSQMGSFGMDFDARLGPPGLAHAAYSYRVVNRNNTEVFVHCSTRMDTGASSAGVLWQRMLVFRADSPAIQVVSEVVPDRAMHVAYGTRSSITLAGPAGQNGLYFARGSARAKTINASEAPGEWQAWLRPGKKCVAGAVAPSAGEGVAIVVAQPHPKFVRLGLDGASGAVHLDLSFPVQAASRSARYRAIWSIIPLRDVKSVMDVLSKVSLLKPEAGVQEAAAQMPPLPGPQEPDANKGVRRLLVASVAGGEELYGFRGAFDSLPFPVEVQDVACVRGEYWPGENEFLQGLPASARAWSRYAAAVFVDVPGWAFAQGDGKRLRDYVENGGNLIFVGDQGRGYRDTPLGSLIPLKAPYDKFAGTDLDGRELLSDLSPWASIALPGFVHPALRGLPRNDLPKTVVHQAVPSGSVEVLATAGVHPALVVRKVGQGHVVSMPISLSDMRQRDPAVIPGLLVKSEHLDDTLTRWCFYDDLWRQLLAWLCGHTPKVFFSGLSVVHRRVLTVPSKLVFEYELGNACANKTPAEVHIDFWRDGRRLDQLHAKQAFALNPRESVGQQLSVSLDAARGRYRYVLSVRDAEGRTLDWRDGAFVALPETYLAIDLGALKVFSPDRPVPVQIFVHNIKANRLLIKAGVFDESGKCVASLEDAVLKDIALGKMAVERVLDAPRLRPGRYSVRAALYAGADLKQPTDAASEAFKILPRHSPAAFPIVFGGLTLGGEDEIGRQVKSAGQVGATAIQLPERSVGSARPDAVAGQRLLSLMGHAHEARLRMVGEMPHVARFLFSRACLPALASQPLPPDVTQAIRDYAEARTHDPSYLGVGLLCPELPAPHLHCERCQKVFRAKFGYDMPGAEAPQRYYHARKFLSDATGPAIQRVREAISQVAPSWKTVAIVDPKVHFTGAYDPLQLCQAFHVVALCAAAPAHEHRLWLDVLRGATSSGGAEFWGGVQVLPLAGDAWSPHHVPMQAYEALGRGAKGLYLRGYREGPHTFTDSNLGVEATAQCLAELGRVGPLFRDLRPKPSPVGLVYPWASFLSGHPRRTVERLARARDALEAAFGPLTVVHENAVIDKAALAELTTAVVVESPCLPERLGRALEAWVCAGGNLVAIGKVGVMDERRLPSRFAERVLGVSYGAEAVSPNAAFSTDARHGVALGAVEAEVLTRYPSGQAAAVGRNMGKGRAVTFGFLPTGADLRRILRCQPDPKFATSDDPGLSVCTLTDGRSPAHYVVVVDRGLHSAGDVDVFTLNDGQDRAQLAVPVARPDTPRATGLWLPQIASQPYVFDLVSGLQLRVREDGAKRYVALKLRSGRGRVLGVFPTKPARLGLRAKVAKQQLQYTVSVLDASGKPVPYALPVEVGITDAAGTPLPGYMGTRPVVGGTLECTVRLPAKCAEGQWTVRARLSVANLTQKVAVPAH